jgi:hypothetical protein
MASLSRRYSPEQVDRGLLAYAVTGNYATARELLQQQGIAVPRKTLEHWVKKLHRERFVQLSNDHAGQYVEAMKADLRAIVARANDATLDALDKTSADFSKLEPRDQAGAARNIATVGAIAMDKLAALEGRPAAIVNHELNADDLLLKVQQIVGSKWQPDVIDSTATELETETN